MNFRFLRLALFALISSLLTGCLDYEEEMTVQSDLSGELKATVTLPDALIDQFAGVQSQFSNEKVREYFEGLSGVSLTRYEFTPGRRGVAKFWVKFNSLEQLNAAIEAREPASVLLGKVTVIKGDGKAVIERQLGEGKSVKGLPDSHIAMYTMRFKSPITATNSGLYNNHGREVRYRYSLADIYAQKPVLSTTVELPLPWLWICLGSTGVLVLLWLAWRYFSSSSRSRR